MHVGRRRRGVPSQHGQHRGTPTHSGSGTFIISLAFAGRYAPPPVSVLQRLTDPFSQTWVTGDPGLNISGTQRRKKNLPRWKFNMGLVHSNNVGYPPDKSVVSWVNRQSRSQSTSLRTRYEGAHGNVRHVHERPSRELPLDRGIEYDQFQLS